MFNKESKELRKEIAALKEERDGLLKKVAEVKLEAKMSAEDIKHMVKMKTEKSELDFERREVQADQERSEAIAMVKDEYRAKVESGLESRIDSIRDMYSEILELVPSVKVKLKGKVG